MRGNAESIFVRTFNFKYIRYENSLCVIVTFFHHLLRNIVQSTSPQFEKITSVLFPCDFGSTTN